MKKLLVAFVASLVLVASLGFAQSGYVGAKWFSQDRVILDATAYKEPGDLAVNVVTISGQPKTLIFKDIKGSQIRLSDIAKKLGNEEPRELGFAIVGKTSNGFQAAAPFAVTKDDLAKKTITVDTEGQLK